MKRLAPVALLAVLLTVAAAGATAPEDTLAAAERAFAEGVESRADAETARPAFARAAAAYDDLWARGHRNPELALNRSRAHRLAGSLPRAVAALHDGLAVARFSRPLQVELEDARAGVLYPLEGELAAQGKPVPVRTVSTRLSALDTWLLSGLMWLVACGSAARFVATRRAAWLAWATVGLCGLGALAALWVQDARARGGAESLPLLVVAEDVHLRKGNAAEYPPRIEPALPRGAEVRELSRRGGWVQVQLPGGTAGWLPEPAVLPCGR
ncbi:hypothetical protein GobsT_64980 [Gemmata obscuriglobus]|uniref:SH3 domain-containing protein n=1 Tax=Gemmata obscuriglobus TaxID=114 RepID=A0A2Z3GWQ1_9BACT|nr:hypothetical protein [Gemmata obscuriglobus]AWM35806.1 hypothetical protein C1280_01360 [Gemmata obscuriglobus]QEG31654.1 hypothetical protein GobsT_64980 [Gemmata obscuriglobus]VTS10999.1 Uncharacterized protein OS=Candidatus Entotheonella sp. TSY1 GN=ETSY1_32175 PE=4 SV=1 [Gemmata obscuriglobus UQM 2246]